MFHPSITINAINRYRLSIAIVCFLLLYLALYPLYQYIFDDDGVGYFMVAKRLAEGDFFNAINGYWSPLHSWLIVPLLKVGMNEFTAIRISNACIGAGILLFVKKLTDKTNTQELLKTVILFVAIPITLSFCFFELAADVLLCFFLLIYIDLATTPQLFEKKEKIICCGIIGAVCYFSKTYAFPFFIVHFILLQFILYFDNPVLRNRSALLTRNIVLGLGAFFALAIPWIILLHVKYHFFTFGYSGQLNLSWKLAPDNSRQAGFFVPPLIPGSPCNWEDPYNPANRAVNSFSSFPIFLRQVRVILDNFMQALACFSDLCFFSTGIILAVFINTCVKNNLLDKIFLLTVLLLPAGYLIVHIESRFLWVSSFLLLISGTSLLSAFAGLTGKRLQILIWVFFFGSFLIYPVNSLKDNAGNGKDLFMMADQFKAIGVSGRLASNSNYGVMERIAYLNKNQYYSLVKLNYTYEELAQQLAFSKINYYFFFYDTLQELESFKKTSLFEKTVVKTYINQYKIVILKISS